ncbi:FlxA-like family protein [Shewanella morhuae]|uniref:FlxA-like family protein n=1 Tax=Shewanella morhuae TaxID=365591 RepID=UPI001BB87260|nr:FlxA-like family protein [Shewanella morhuae]GIU06891.1 hypothetical protein TUM4641_18640 [Shewanella morhuae]
MNINGINSTTTGSAFTPVSNAYIAATPTTKAANTEPTTDSPDAQDTVSISNAGRVALSIDVGSTLRDKASAQKEQLDTATSEEPKSIIDAQVQKIKEQIKALQEILAKLKGDDSDAADQQRKLIQEQIMQLSGQIATLMDQKIRDAKESA